MDRNQLFQQLCGSVAKAYPSKSKKQAQDVAVAQWNELKKQDPKEFTSLVLTKISDFEKKSMDQRGKLLQYWAKAGTSKPTVQSSSEATEVADSGKDIPAETAGSSGVKRPAESTAPAQQQLKNDLARICDDIVKLREREDAGLFSEEDAILLKKLVVDRKKKEDELRKKVKGQERQKKFRAEQKKSMQTLLENIPQAKDYLNVHSAVGRPSIEEKQPELLATLVSISLHGSAAEGKRHDESIRSVKTLSELQEALQLRGFQISRSATYLRLLPRRSNTQEGKRHITTVPVKLLRATNDQHSKHQDGEFCTATINMLEEMSSLLGPNEVAFISQDDKARVAIGVTAANKQAPLLMHLEYRVTLPDHDWVVANRHKLIPSVYAGITIKPNGIGQREAVGYTGPTYVAIRSGKHSSSTAYSHGLDYERLLDLPEFADIMLYQGNVKPVHVVIVDGGPDENPRYRKVINVAIHHFRKHQLDALFLATNAPGRSAFNRVERRMAPLSRELSGLILPHDHYGSHLDDRLRTTDSELEKKNFKYAGETLAKIWNDLTFDGFPVISEYIDPTSMELTSDSILRWDSEWFSAHVRSSHYFLQIVKCSDRECCSEPRSSYFDIMPTQFFSAPIRIKQTEDGLKAVSPSLSDSGSYVSLFLRNSMNTAKILPKSLPMYKELPYDLYCPSVQKVLQSRICRTCGIYFASKVMLTEHNQIHKTGQAGKKPRGNRHHPIAKRGKEVLIIEDQEAIWTDEDSDTSEAGNVGNDSEIPIISIDQHLQPVWRDL